MRSKIAVVVGLLLALGIGAAILFWPTPRREAIARIHELGGQFREDEDSDGRKLVIVSLTGKPVTNEDLLLLHNIRPLHRLLLDGTQITDVGLANLEGLEELEWVSVCNTQVTDAGMAHLRKIPTLTSIHVRKTSVSDAGLAYLHGMPKLDFINVAETRVTKAGIEALRKSTPSLQTVYFEQPAEDD